MARSPMQPPQRYISKMRADSQQTQAHRVSMPRKRHTVVVVTGEVPIPPLRCDLRDVRKHVSPNFLLHIHPHLHKRRGAKTKRLVFAPLLDFKLLGITQYLLTDRGQQTRRLWPQQQRRPWCWEASPSTSCTCRFCFAPCGGSLPTDVP